MDNSSNTVLTKRVAARLNIICCFNHSGSHLFVLHNKKSIQSDAESREEQDSSKQKFVGGTMAKLWPVFCQGVVKNTEE